MKITELGRSCVILQKNGRIENQGSVCLFSTQIDCAHNARPLQPIPTLHGLVSFAVEPIPLTPWQVAGMTNPSPATVVRTGGEIDGFSPLPRSPTMHMNVLWPIIGGLERSWSKWAKVNGAKTNVQRELRRTTTCCSLQIRSKRTEQGNQSPSEFYLCGWHGKFTFPILLQISLGFYTECYEFFTGLQPTLCFKMKGGI